MQHVSTCSRSRRSFLRGCGLTLTGFGIASVFPRAFIEHVLASSGPSSSRRFLFIFLRGGNDGLNTVIPYGDPDYNATNRPTLYVDPLNAIDLNGFASVHPSLQNIMDTFNAGELAVIHRVGYANNTRSHFDAQRVWENGNPTQTNLFEGWLYRYIQEHAVAANVDLPVISVQSTPPILVQGEEKFINVANPDEFAYAAAEPLRSKYAAGWRGNFAGLLGLEAYRPVLSQTGVKLADILDEYASWDQANWDPKDPDTGWSLFPVDAATNQAGFDEEAYEFFRGIKVSALSLLESDGTNNGTRIAGTQLDGWDTHGFQGSLAGSHAERLSWLAYAIKSLRIVLSGAATDPRNYASIWNDTVVATMSEFGRTSKENGSNGTDHAAASCLFVAGGGVNGGVYNCDGSTWPAGVMFGVNNRYLLERTDYRAIFWELLRDHMGAAQANVETIFPAYTALGLGSQELALINNPVPQPTLVPDPTP